RIQSRRALPRHRHGARVVAGAARREAGSGRRSAAAPAPRLGPSQIENPKSKIAMIFIVDNYDSFTYNLVQAVGKIDRDVVVARNDRFDPREVVARRPQAILISPGPGRPENAGRTIEMIAAAEAKAIPLLGVCLGHQAIAAHHGGVVERAPAPRH